MRSIETFSSNGRARARTSRAPGLERAPYVAATGTALPPHLYRQEEITALVRQLFPALDRRAGALERLFARVGVGSRHLALPAERYASLRGLGDRNDAWIESALSLSTTAIESALAEAGLEAGQIDQITTTTVTGLAVPSLDARLMNTLDFPRSLTRVPLFGLGCLGGAAGLARVADYLRAYPDRAAVLLAVELCSLTFQPDDATVANLISTGLFGDGAAAVVMLGSEHPKALRAPSASGGQGSRVLASRSAFFPSTERIMGWDVIDSGFKVVLSPDVPKLVRERVPAEVDGFLAMHGLERRDVARWIVHPGGPKVIDALEEGLELAPGALEPTRRSLAEIGNLSSASVLFLLDEHRRRPWSRGSLGVMMAMGPAFCAELVLLELR